LLEHYEALLTYYGTHQAVQIARKHIAWYCEGMPGSDELRAEINQLKDPDAVKARLTSYFSQAQPCPQGLQ
jgi:tRNA-dihydrouridine synthase B